MDGHRLLRQVDKDGFECFGRERVGKGDREVGSKRVNAEGVHT